MKKSLFNGGLIACVLLSLTACSTVLKATNDDQIKPDPSERTIGTIIDDERLETIAKVNLDKAHPGLESAHINVVAYNGVVLLTGQVANQNLRELATQTVAKLPKTREVFNELEIGNKTTFITRSNDTWLTTKVKAQLLANKDINGKQVKVICEDGVVYLMGLLTRNDAAQAADSARIVAGVKKVVKAIEYLD